VLAAVFSFLSIGAEPPYPVAVFDGGETIVCPAEILDPPNAEAAAHMRCDRILNASFQVIRAHYRAELERQGFTAVDDFGSTALFLSRGAPPDQHGALIDVVACRAPGPSADTCLLALIDRTDLPKT